MLGTVCCSTAVSWAIVVTSVFSVAVSCSIPTAFSSSAGEKEFGLYNILGMEKRHLAKVIFWETAMMRGRVSLTIGTGPRACFWTS